LVSHVKGGAKSEVVREQGSTGIFGPKRDEVIRDCRYFNSEELHILFSSPNVIRQIKSRRMSLAWHVARIREERKVSKVLAGKPEGKGPLGIPKSR
jgi:hypothetical protein